MFRGLSRISLLYFSKSKNVSVTLRQNPVFDLLQSRFSDSGGLKVRAVSAVNIRYMSTPVSSSSVATTDTATQPVELLAAVNDHYDGVMVDMKEPVDPQVFASSLDASISHWRLQGKKGVWIKLPTKLVNLVEAAVKKGFWYHHAESDYLMLVYWIPETVHTIPASASHRLGVGAFVINDKKEVLVVQEKSGRFKGTGLWKFPTGVVDEGEDICVAAAREVKEETGIDAEFVEVLGFRQSHNAFFGKSDLFFLCMLRPLSFTIKKQEREIEAAEWMPIEEYAAQPFLQNHGLLKYMIDVGLAAANREYSGFSPVPTDSMFSKDKSFLYLNCKDLSKLKNSGNQP